MTWYTWQDGVHTGPYEEQQVRELTLGQGALVWREGAAGWLPWDHYFGPSSTGEAQRACAQCRRLYGESWLGKWGGVEVCAFCKPRHVAGLREGATLPGDAEYGNWGARFAARLIDGIILAFVNSAIQLPLFMVAGIGKDPASMGMRFAIAYGVVVMLQLVVQCGYEVWFLVKKGATPGKMVLQLQVVDSQGRFLKVGRAFGRYFGQYITGLTLGIGYLMPLWDNQKRALHDMVADTRVVKK